MCTNFILFALFLLTHSLNGEEHSKLGIQITSLNVYLSHAENNSQANPAHYVAPPQQPSFSAHHYFTFDILS